MNGIINVLKPPGMSSHDIVYFIRKKLNIKKVGHTGTLDPEAAGVLPICIGKATKAVQYITDKKKKYRAHVKFGIETDTYDKYGKIIKKIEIENINIEKLNNVINQFKGVIEQMPPIYSAIKYNGKKLYQYALEDEKVEIEKRKVEIYSLNIIDIIQPDEIIIDVQCSKGTYIRSLCHDIGKEMGNNAYMSQLIRVESTPFNIETSNTIEEIEEAVKNNKIDSFIYPVDIIFKAYPIVNIKATAKNAALNGCRIYQQGIFEDINIIDAEKNVRIYSDEQFMGIGIIRFNEDEARKYLKIEKMFI